MLDADDVESERRFLSIRRRCEEITLIARNPVSSLFSPFGFCDRAFLIASLRFELSNDALAF